MSNKKAFPAGKSFIHFILILRQPCVYTVTLYDLAPITTVAW
jgi:hypothetical protein